MFNRQPTKARTQTLKRAGASVAVLALAAGLVACGGDDSEGTKKPEPVASVDPAKVSPSDLPEIPKVKSGKGAIADVTFGDCATKAGKQSVEATVTNPGQDSARYAVVVSWINETSDVLARGVADVEQLGAGSTVDVDLTATVPKGADSCTFYVLRGTAR